MNEVVKILVITILAELIVVALLTILGSFFSKKARLVFTVIFGRLLDIDVEHVFRNKSEADGDIQEEMNRSSWVCLLTGRGNELQRETFAWVFARTPKEAKPNFRILLPVAKSITSEPDWIAQREQEIAAVDTAFGKGILSDQIETTVKFLSSYISTGTVELRRFNYPHIGRILITDRVAYFTPYRRDAHGRNSHVIKYRRGGEMYDWFLRLFNQLWGCSSSDQTAS